MTTPRQEYFYALAREDFERHDRDIRSPSGADQAEAEYYRLRRQVWVWMADGGTELAEALERLDAAWRTYAAHNNAKVDAAPRKTGIGNPCAGQSAISHRWVPPDKVTQIERAHIAAMCARAPTN